MPIKCEDYQQVCVAAVDGDFTAENSAALRAAVDQSIDQRQIVDFVVDLEKCPFIDSQGLETLLWLKRRCEDLFGRMKLAQVSEEFRKILEITRLGHRFEVHQELASALKTMR